MEMSSRRSILGTMFNVTHEVKSSGIVAYNQVTDVCVASLYLQEQCCLCIVLLALFCLLAYAIAKSTA